MQLKYYSLKAGGNENIFRISWVVLGVNIWDWRKHKRHWFFKWIYHIFKHPKLSWQDIISEYK